MPHHSPVEDEVGDRARVENAGPRLASMAPALAGSALVAGAIWWASLTLLPPVAAMDTVGLRLEFALKCIAVSALLTLALSIEAVAHERFTGAAFDPLAGNKQSRRLQVNLRNLQNTLEQFALFAPALLVLAIYCEGGAPMRAVVAATIVWVLARYVFWIGYHIGSQHRLAGLVGHAQTMLLLLYVSARFGYEVGGVWGAVAPLLLFVLTEVAIVSSLRRR